MDQRYIKKEQQIRYAFKTLLANKYFEDISVSELCRLASIDRKTFYLHYQSLDDLLEATQKELTDEFSNLVKGLDPIDDLYECTKQFFYFSESQGRFYERLTLNNENSYIRNQMIKDVMTRSVDETTISMDRSFKIGYIVNATLYFYKEWVRREKKMPINDIIDLTVNTIRNGINK